jgi:hypothetical protein
MRTVGFSASNTNTNLLLVEFTLYVVLEIPWAINVGKKVFGHLADTGCIIVPLAFLRKAVAVVFTKMASFYNLHPGGSYTCGVVV